MNRLRNLRCLLAMLGVLLVWGRGARAETPSPQLGVPTSTDVSVTLRDVLKQLREHSPRMAVARAEVNVAAADKVAASLYPNPTLSYEAAIGIHRPDYVNGTQHQVTYSQPFLVSGQRGARERAAEQGVTAARAELTAFHHARAGEGRKLFVSLVAAQERSRLLQEAYADLQRAQVVVDGRAQNGMMSHFDTVRMDVELKTLQARIQVARAQTTDLSGKLSELLGCASVRLHAVGNLDVDGKSPQAAESLPEVALAKRAEAVSLARVEVAKREHKPVPVVGAGGIFTTEGFTLAATLGLALDLPLFDQGQGAVAKAVADAELSSRAREAVVSEAAHRLTRTQSVFDQQRQALQLFEHDALTQLPELRQMGDAAYQSGQGTILNLLDTEHTITETRLLELELREGVALAHVDSLVAAGLADSETP